MSAKSDFHPSADRKLPRIYMSGVCGHGGYYHTKGFPCIVRPEFRAENLTMPREYAT
jgi:hypothetical protein